MPSWHHQDLTTLAGAPVNISGDPTSFFNPTSFFDPTSSALHVFYRGWDVHMHKLWWQNGVWQHTDLTPLAGAPATTAGSPTSPFAAPGRAEHVFYAGNDYHIHELRWENGVWQHTDLTPLAGAPANAIGNPTSFFNAAGSAYHVFYSATDSDHHIHELRGESGVWQHTDLTTAADAPAPKFAGYLTGFFEPTGRAYHVFYCGGDYHIHELRWENGVWQHADLSTTAGAVAYASGYLTSFFDQANAAGHVFYRGGDNHIHELQGKGGVWQHTDLTTAAGASGYAFGNPTGFFDAIGRAEHVFYRGGDRHIHKLQGESGVWRHRDLTTAAGAPANVSGNPTSFLIRVESVSLSIQYHYVFYRGSDGHIYALWWD
jgi:hypothetical protein